MLVESTPPTQRQTVSAIFSQPGVYSDPGEISEGRDSKLMMTDKFVCSSTCHTHTCTVRVYVGQCVIYMYNIAHNVY